MNNNGTTLELTDREEIVVRAITHELRESLTALQPGRRTLEFPAPIVHMPAPDLAPVLELLEGMERRLNEQPLPVVNVSMQPFADALERALAVFAQTTTAALERQSATNERLEKALANLAKLMIELAAKKPEATEPRGQRTAEIDNGDGTVTTIRIHEER